MKLKRRENATATDQQTPKSPSSLYRETSSAFSVILLPARRGPEPRQSDPDGLPVLSVLARQCVAAQYRRQKTCFAPFVMSL
ncbi:retinoblastoma protein (IC) [Corchorus olitorius]|uniref:Retinoblastoma protein (IC) n=1 Tax=Corchorus olitorius TaxID=93759 RepID=A0A1R3L159_9ROSI|nr:retinoblastoma protein (IC) [Corchorus olitorius]